MLRYDALKSSLVGLGSHHASRRHTDRRFRRPMHCLYVAVVEAGPKVVLGQPTLKTTGPGEMWYLISPVLCIEVFHLVFGVGW